MTDRCELKHSLGEDVPCDQAECTYWRLVGHLGVAERDSGCAIQHFQLLDGGRPIAEWLLSVKERVEQENG